MKNIYIITLFLALALTTACEKEDPEIQNTATYPVSGEWWVNYQVRDAQGQLEDVGGGYQQFLTFNTSSNRADSIWVSDAAHFWDFQVKAGLNLENRTFAVNEGQNVSYNSKVRINNGKVLLGQGRSTSGVVTDSLYLEASFDDDEEPFGITYIISGHRRTGFLEDEH